ncbi:MAG TPA: hypothetical protein VLE70_13750 [Anaerolineae bacterium]|nr:hypothetical protein [Anaerolineae bacterium]
MTELSLSNAPFLELVNEQKIYKLLSGSSEEDTIDASGICVMDGDFYVTFEDSAHIARFGASLSADDPANALRRNPDDDIGREDITYDADLQRFLIITEAVKQPDGTYMPKVTSYDAQLHFIEESRLEFALQGKHKGMEGIACIRRNDRLYLLGLCEGNLCHGGRRGRRPGGGRIQLFQKEKGKWARTDMIELPAGLPFENYSSLALNGDQIAVVSRESSALWIGALRKDTWAVVDDGAVYRFPLSKKGKLAYCAIDGISWLSDDTFVAVSDRSGSVFGFQKRCRKKDQSVHIFKLSAS